MSDQLKPQDPATENLARPLYTPIKRRSFFMYAGATAGATALLLSGCDDDDENNTDDDPATSITDVGSADVGVLNYAYALEQLEAAFYAQVVAGSYYAGASAAEKQILGDIAIHERIHVDFFRTAITAATTANPTLMLKPLNPEFGAIDFTSKTSVLGAARTFEDLGVAAYNGAGQFITNPDYLVLAGKIVSVEARHAGLIRDLITTNTFVGEDVVNFNLTGANARQEKSKLPAEVLASANTFLKADSQLSATRLV
ncbi:ferritin-like domain-containing protein [uncultured Hymenobacter sp.]|uniref:ferritin-like domain-containing protein n=1 Tax=uncultured Hymenobacter sp. TaxID=170016 RepID=UPI0035C952D3